MRTSEQVTRDSAVDISGLMHQAGVTPNTVAVLLGVPTAVLTNFFIRNVRPAKHVVLGARRLLNAIIALKDEPADEFVRNDPAQIRRLLQERSARVENE